MVATLNINFNLQNVKLNYQVTKLKQKTFFCPALERYLAKSSF
jgi:hypothetical protein